MSDRLKGKTVLVTGSTRGIGRSMAEHFAAEGARVAVTGRTVERGQKVVDRIRAAGGEAEFFSLDVTSEASIREVVEAVVARFGGLSTLVNNAAPTDAVAGTMKPLHEYDTAEWERIMTGTLTGNVFWATKYAWPHLVRAEGASILNISSGQSLSGFKGFAAYGAAKAGVNSLTRSLAVEGSADGIRANCILVGRVVASKGDSGHHTGGGRLTRIGNPMDIAYAATWLVSDEAEFATGSMVTVDGGFSINGDAVSDAESLSMQAV
ncbi:MULTISPECIES: SDR family NAD(P)-dependent oxidoreductase [Rhodococcus]|uniref:SDR family oxidoreductase n=1 Tax=Rhodococcus chondri TaxID=3065941 RepID=A0ABU7JMA5_9NOCA|nr:MULTISPECIES: SDR family oxidoreductase [unclassified Rhodococcus (in: high G+C Gram-positive bacteria)]MEE2030847.1 SDR family oxidoreductase [Rhodococcus sp. CC-R104]TCN53631.1 NAD(P)-dependent dehydrogenase (short-subunit alcohol dehydrogenase family) [Rhodococcus sp. SMB37]